MWFRLGNLELECFRLAGILSTGSDVRHELLETLVGGKYLNIISHVVIAWHLVTLTGGIDC